MRAHTGFAQSVCSFSKILSHYKHTSMYITVVTVHLSCVWKLMDDFALVRPTIVASTPRFWTILYNQYLHSLYEAYTAYLAESASREAIESRDPVGLQPEGESEADETRCVGEREADEVSAAGLDDVGAVDGASMRKEVHTEGKVSHGVTITAGEDGAKPDGVALPLHSDTEDKDGGADVRESTVVGLDGSLEAEPDIDIEVASPDNSEEDHELQRLTSVVPPTPSNFDPASVPLPITQQVLKQFRGVLGGREQIVSTGGAPTGEAVKRFMLECFRGIPQEGYGTTEVRVHLA